MRPKNVNKYVYWIPRILSIVFLCFLALFSLDVITPEVTFWEVLVGLFMHNVPVFILAILLWISWKYEIVGGVAFILAGLVYIGFIIVNIIRTGFEWYYLAWAVQISGIAFIIGILFLVGWFKRKK